MDSPRSYVDGVTLNAGNAQRPSRAYPRTREHIVPNVGSDDAAVMAVTRAGAASFGHERKCPASRRRAKSLLPARSASER